MRNDNEKYEKEVVMEVHDGMWDITVTRPILPPDVYEQRHKALERAAAALLRSKWENEQQLLS